MRSEPGTMNVYWPRSVAANDVPCSQCLTAEHHSALASARTRSSHPAGDSQRPIAKVLLGHVLPAGPLSPLLNRDLRAELRF